MYCFISFEPSFILLACASDPEIHLQLVEPIPPSTKDRLGLVRCGGLVRVFEDYQVVDICAVDQDKKDKHNQAIDVQVRACGRVRRSEFASLEFTYLIISFFRLKP